MGRTCFADWIYEKMLRNAKPDKVEQSKSRELIKEIRQEFTINCKTKNLPSVYAWYVNGVQEE